MIEIPSKILFTLLRAAMTPGAPAPVPASGPTPAPASVSGTDPEGLRILCEATAADWRGCIDLAFLQDVNALALDGYHKYLAAYPDMATNLDSAEVEADKYDWFSSTLQVEDEYRKCWRVATKISSFFAAKGIKTYVLKGFSVTALYPVPEHRHSCDCDIFLSDYELGNKLLESKGIEVDRNYYKNSTFYYDGVMVENHRFCLPVRGDARKKRLEKFLQGIIADGESRLGDSQLWSPGPLFTAIFLTEHAHTHFLMEGMMTLRHLLDWALVMKAYAGSGIWAEYLDKCREAGIIRFAYAISRLAGKLYCIDIPFECPENDLADKRMLDDVLSPAFPVVHRGTRLGTRLYVARTMFGSAWKYRLYSDTTMFSSLCRSVAAYFFERNPELK